MHFHFESEQSRECISPNKPIEKITIQQATATVFSVLACNMRPTPHCLQRRESNHISLTLPIGFDRVKTTQSESESVNIDLE